MQRGNFGGKGDLKPPQFSPRVLGIGVAAVALLVVVLTVTFTIDPEEEGLVLRFGAYNRTVGPGLNFKLPWPIESVEKLAVRRQLKQEFGFRTEQAGVRSSFAKRGYVGESLMLTGDLNVADVEWITQYRIDSPYDFRFKVRRVDETFRDMNEAVMRQVIGDRSVTEVLTVGRQEIASEVKQLLQELCDQYEIGIKVEQVVLQDVNPPDEVKDAFNAVIPRAKGEAQQTIQQAEGYATDRVNRARGDAELFKAVLTAYKKAPDVTRRRIYLETMNEIYPKVKRKIVVDARVDNLLPLLNLGEAQQ